jgi:hypothetical protein
VPARALRLLAAVIAAAAAGCGSAQPPSATPDGVIQARQTERLKRLAQRHDERDQVLSRVTAQRQVALAELRRMEQVKGRSKEGIKGSRYGSDGTGDPEPWLQSGANATRAPNSRPETIAAFQAAVAAGRIRLVGAASGAEVARGLIDDRVLGMLLVLSQRHRLEVNSLRVSHPKSVQDDLGTPTSSNHIYGRAADISAVDAVPCIRESRRAAYRTVLDNPPPARPGPCLALAIEAAGIGGDVQAGEIIYYWRVPGPTGVSMPNHDDHVHIGYRHYPSVSPVATAPAASTSPGRAPQAPPANSTTVDSGADLQLPDPGKSRTLTVPGN